MQRNIAIFLAALGFLGGCADMGPRIEGWPELTVHEHYVPHAEMRKRCARYAGLAISCAEVRFAEARCDIWFSADRPPSEYVRRHERLHCAGHDHEHVDTLRSALSEYRRQAGPLASLQN